MFDKLFPLKLQLKIFQLEGYDPIRFIVWVFKNFWTRKVAEKKNLVITLKVRFIKVFFVSLLIVFFTTFSFISNNILLSLLLSLLIATQPYLILVASSFIFIPLESLYKFYIIQKTRNKILSLKNLKVIAITGSYGKSSTKELLYQLLKDRYKVLRTPESYNTIFGISKVVDYELDENYDIFICEMAAYHRGNIKKLCYMIPPNYGILTGITSQHIERFGNLKNIINTKFELVEKIKDTSRIVFNLIDINVNNEQEKRKIINPIAYFVAENISLTKNGSEFYILFKGKGIKIKTPLFGFANIENLLGAAKMANILGISIKEIVKKASNLEQISNRSKITTYGKATFVDNTFSSNEQAFREMLKNAKNVKGSKILITPGLVELGNFEREIHKNLGMESRNIFSKIILVGKNNRTLAFSDGLQEDVEFIDDSRKDYFNKVEEVKDRFDWVFLENDVTENY